MAKSARQKSLWDAEPSADPSPPASVSAHPTPAGEAVPTMQKPLAMEGLSAGLEGKSVYVIDSHSLIHQVFHALPEMTSPKGEPVQAVFGFLRDVLYLVESKKPDYLLCAVDLPGKTFRHELFERYKIQRPPMDIDLVPQIGLIRQVLERAGIPVLGVETFEADDILATVSREVEEQGGQCHLVTGDKDCRQLLTDLVKVYNIRKDQVYDRDSLAKDWGVRPDQVVDFQSLVGDATDGVPGVPLIGPVAAKQLLEKFGTLEEVLKHPEAVTGAKRQENLRTYGEQALLSRQLVRLERYVPLTVDWHASEVRGFRWGDVRETLADLGFRSLLVKIDALDERVHEAKRTAEFITHVVDTPEKLAELVTLLRRLKSFSFDTETTSIEPRRAELVGCSFSWADNEAWYLPVRTPPGEPHVEPQAAIEALRPVLEDPSIAKIGQNLKYDMIVLRSAGVELAGLAFDSMVASYLLDAGQRNHNLDDLADRYLQHETIKITELIGTGKNQRRMDEVPVAQISRYAGEDALLVVRLQPLLAQRLSDSHLDDLFGRVELPLVEVLAELEYNGVKVDVSRLRELSQRYGRRMEELEQEIYQLAGHRFNLASPKQLQTVLFEEQKLPVVKKTKTGASTDVEVLEELARIHPLPARIIEYRQYAKLKSTYVDALPELVYPATGRVHTAFNQVVTATGRLSSSEPNLQNIPVRTEEGREIRSAFVPGEEGWVLLAADYSQIELRVLAHFCGDENLCAAFARDEDIHALVASQIHKVPLAEVTEPMRRQAKTVNFGIIYGQSAFGLAKQLGIEQEEAGRFIDSYFEGYPGVEKFLDKILAECRACGYVNTILGRRRAIDGVRDRPGRQKNLAERTAVNTVIQGSAADLIKLAMIAIHRRLRRERLAARMLLQIHDELIFEVPSDQVDYLASLVSEEMVGAQPLGVPLKVDVKVGPNWADAKPWRRPTAEPSSRD
jgi:DNA polymerase-1